MSRFHPVLATIDWFVEHAEALILGSLVAAILVAIMLALRLYGRRLVSRSGEQVTWKTLVGRVLARTSIFFMIAAALNTVATYAEPAPKVARLIYILFTIASGLQGAIWARELILGLISRRVGEGKNGAALDSAMAIIRLLVSFALFAIAIILILDNLGVNVTALVAGLGIGGIAIGLAAQGIFSDLFAALSILFDKPFKRGDTIRYDNTTGTVERIGLKTTRLRSLTGEQRVMSNTKLLEREIQNLAQAKARRLTVYFAVEAPAEVESLDAIAGAAQEAVESQKGCKLVRCVLSGVGSDSFAQGVTYLAHELVYDDKALDNDALARDRSVILRALIEKLAEQNLQLARLSDQPPPLAPF